MSAPINDGGPAFPFDEKNDDGSLSHCNPGMSLRDYFAAHAPCTIPDDFGWAPSETDAVQRLCRWRFHYADEMLKARTA